MSQSLKRTPLYAAHGGLGARLIDFGGWEMPVQYSGIIDEHQAVRQAAGLFDISHMGEVSVEGPGAAAFLKRVLTNDIQKLSPGQGQYTLMCNERGGTIDDLYVYRLEQERFLLMVNSSRTSTDVEWLRVHHRAWSGETVRLENVSDQTGAVAVQGPKTALFIDRCFAGVAQSGNHVSRPSELTKNEVALFEFGSDPVQVARTGYTGEDGFEIIADAALIRRIWDRLLLAGTEFGLKPAGLGARDTLRTEMCYPLYGHELDENTTPIEAGLGYFVALEQGEFIGRAALAAQKAAGTARKLVAFKMTDRSAPPRPGYPIWSAVEDGSSIGVVTSGTQSPSLGIGIGLGYVTAALAKPQTPVAVEIRNKRAGAVIVPKPIYRKPQS